jgi:hypothetical protein
LKPSPGSLLLPLGNQARGQGRTPQEEENRSAIPTTAIIEARKTRKGDGNQASARVHRRIIYHDPDNDGQNAQMIDPEDEGGPEAGNAEEGPAAGMAGHAGRLSLELRKAHDPEEGLPRVQRTVLIDLEDDPAEDDGRNEHPRERKVSHEPLPAADEKGNECPHEKEEDRCGVALDGRHPLSSASA